MPGIPCVYYGSEWGAKANKSEGDPALRACFDAPVENDLTAWISKLATAKKASNALNYGDFRSVVLTNRQCIFERKTDSERVFVAINADGEPYTAHFDAGCGTAIDLITGNKHDLVVAVNFLRTVHFSGNVNIKYLINNNLKDRFVSIIDDFSS